MEHFICPSDEEVCLWLGKSFDKDIVFADSKTLEHKKSHMDWSDNTAGRILASLHKTDLGMISGISYDTPKHYEE